MSRQTVIIKAGGVVNGSLKKSVAHSPALLRMPTIVPWNCLTTQ